MPSAVIRTEDPLDIIQIKKWLKDFIAFENQLLFSQIDEETSAYDKLFMEFGPISEHYEKGVKAHAPDYNLFYILNIRHYETKVHTPFLRHLLDPHETHMQGSLFFNAFFNLIFKERFQSSVVKSVYVSEELAFPDGRMDLLIEYSYKASQRAIVIENKIYHTDEPRQLERYFNHLTTSMGYTADNLHIVYLKPRAGMPGIDSIDPEKLNKLVRNGQFTCLGYHDHIYPMLQRILTHKPTLPSVVKETIVQYLRTIKTL